MILWATDYCIIWIEPIIVVKSYPKLLTDIGVSPETASEDACRIEHVISDESFEAIKSHLPKQGKKSKSKK